jgi:hypothetical protein
MWRLVRQSIKQCPILLTREKLLDADSIVRSYYRPFVEDEGSASMSSILLFLLRELETGRFSQRSRMVNGARFNQQLAYDGPPYAIFAMGRFVLKLPERSILVVRVGPYRVGL